MGKCRNLLELLGGVFELELRAFLVPELTLRCIVDNEARTQKGSSSQPAKVATDLNLGLKTLFLHWLGVFFGPIGLCFSS